MPRLESEGNTHPQEHVLQFYGSDEQALTRNAGQYLTSGLKSGDGLLVIATKTHYQGIVSEMERNGVDPEGAAREGRLIFWDVAEILKQFMDGGLPSWDAFQRTLGPAIAQLEQVSNRLCAYGEMVGVLWKEGKYAAANRVEKFWNRLLKFNSFHLFCAYPIDVFGAEFQTGALDMLLCAHTHLVPASSEESLQTALERAMSDVLGKRAQGVKDLMQTESRHFPTAVPKAEAAILWLRNNLSSEAEAILSRARRYYQLTTHRTVTA